LPSPPEEIEGELEYEIESILKHRKSRNRIQYLVKWKDYGPQFNSWEPEETLLENAAEIINEYKQRIAGTALPKKKALLELRASGGVKGFRAD